MRILALILTFSLGACATLQQSSVPLQPSVTKFNDHLRWKRYDLAARLISPEQQATFYEELSDTEDVLDIQNIEVRHVSILHTKPLRARVLVRSESTTLPSTIVKTLSQTQIWERRPQGWILMDTEPSWFPNATPRDPLVQIAPTPN